MFCLLLLLLRLPLNANVLDPSFSIYVGILLLVVAINHYIIAYGLVKLVNKRKWLLMTICLIGLYIFSAYVSIQSFSVLISIFPYNKIYHSLLIRYGMKDFLDIFSLTTFTWVMSFVFPFSVFTLFIKFYKKSQETANKNLYLQKMNANLELNFLRSQINPHFFFNTLNSLYALTLDNDRAAKIILGFSDMMRFSLYEAKADFILLRREIEFLVDYIKLEKIRHDSRLHIEYSFKVDDDTLSLPPLLLINFIENAFKHGVNTTIGQAYVFINLSCQKGSLVFNVKNSKPPSLKPGNKSELGIGIGNTRRRLNILYPNRHELVIEETIDTFNIILKIKI